MTASGSAPASPDEAAAVRNEVSGGTQGTVLMGRDFQLTAPRPEPVAGPLVSLPPRPQPLAGREDLLATLHDRLTGGERPWPRIVALHGMGGAGKTSLAAEYAHRHQAGARVAWHFPAEDVTVLRAEFCRLAALLGAFTGLLDPRDPVASVHAVLADSPLPWLLVFDNAPDPASVRAFLPGVGHGQVLITSQHGLWPSGQGIEVQPLEIAVAAAFLASESGDLDQAAAHDLAAEAGGLPLALAHAVAYMLATGTSLAGYLKLFRRRRAEILARGDDSSGHPADVAATLGLALSRLEASAPASAALLRLLACLAPEPVPVSLVLADRGISPDLDPGVAAALGPILGDELAAGTAVGALRRYSLIAPAGGTMVLVHRLVQAVTLDQLPAGLAGAWRAAAAVLVEAAIPADPASPATWPAGMVLLPHALAVLELTSIGMFRVATSLGCSGGYAAARNLFRRIEQAYEDAGAYGPEHPQTLAVRGNLARWTGQAGDAAAARDLYAALLPDLERVSGAEHPETLTARGNLARWTGQAGDAAAARDLYAALLPLRERVSGAEHPLTVTARANLARWTGQAGDPVAARDLYAVLLPITERVSGAEHPDTLTDRANLARWTGDAGDPAAARDQFAALLPILERVLGPEHPLTLTARANLARWTGEAGNPAAARDQFAALLPVRERVSGSGHPDTQAARANLARWTRHP